MNDNRTVSADGWEHCVALGSVGFSRGVHYWEFTIDKYTSDTDPAFGVARIDVSRDKMLGKNCNHKSPHFVTYSYACSIKHFQFKKILIIFLTSFLITHLNMYRQRR
jgi:hypothetical protein